jgi:MFS transporter, putative metabolite:H+ symporter
VGKRARLHHRFLRFQPLGSDRLQLVAEHYPTRAPTTGFALADGVGHLGGGVGMLLIAPLIPSLGVLASMLLISGFLVVGALIAQFGVSTRSRALEEVSP